MSGRRSSWRACCLCGDPCGVVRPDASCGLCTSSVLWPLLHPPRADGRPRWECDLPLGSSNSDSAMVKRYLATSSLAALTDAAKRATLIVSTKFSSLVSGRVVWPKAVSRVRPSRVRVVVRQCAQGIPARARKAIPCSPSSPACLDFLCKIGLHGSALPTPVWADEDRRQPRCAESPHHAVKLWAMFARTRPRRGLFALNHHPLVKFGRT